MPACDWPEPPGCQPTSGGASTLHWIFPPFVVNVGLPLAAVAVTRKSRDFRLPGLHQGTHFLRHRGASIARAQYGFALHLRVSAAIGELSENGSENGVVPKQLRHLVALAGQRRQLLSGVRVENETTGCSQSAQLRQPFERNACIEKYRLVHALVESETVKRHRSAYRHRRNICGVHDVHGKVSHRAPKKRRQG